MHIGKKVIFLLGLLQGVSTGLAQERGINLPPQRYTSNYGAFMPGAYDYGYSNATFEAMKAIAATNRWPEGFSPRFCINDQTANQPAKLKQVRDHFLRAGGRGIICWFETTTDTNQTHASGRVQNLDEISRSWRLIHQTFAEMPGIRYEIFNEPFGYTSAQAYLQDMTNIIHRAGLPAARCILDGIGYAEDVKSVARAGWQGDLAYHFYPNWLPAGNQTADAYSQRVIKDIGGLSRRIFLTEFGADLRISADWQVAFPNDKHGAADVNSLLGLRRALKKFRDEGDGIKGAFIWHGWNNDDNYDFWCPKNQAGAAAEIAVLNSL